LNRRAAYSVFKVQVRGSFINPFTYPAWERPKVKVEKKFFSKKFSGQMFFI
jgi:hypothetical protein